MVDLNMVLFDAGHERVVTVAELAAAEELVVLLLELIVVGEATSVTEVVVLLL